MVAISELARERQGVQSLVLQAPRSRYARIRAISGEPTGRGFAAIDCTCSNARREENSAAGASMGGSAGGPCEPIAATIAAEK
jgi:hypothetical protein